MIRQWLLLSSVAFGVGFGVSLPLSRDLKQSAFAGIAAIPATSASVLLLERNKKQKLTKSLRTLNSEVQDLDSRKQSLTVALTADTKLADELQEKISELRIELPQLQSTIALYQEQQNVEKEALTKLELRQQQYEAAIAALAPQLEQLERSLQVKQQELESVAVAKQQQEAEIQELRSQLATQQQSRVRLDATITQQQTQQQVYSEQLAELERQRQQKGAEIESLTVELQELQTSLRLEQQNIQNIVLEKQGQNAELARLQSNQQQSKSELDAIITQQQTQQQVYSEQLANLEQQQQEKETAIASLSIELQALGSRLQSEQQALQTITLEKQAQDAELGRLRAQVSIQQQRKSELDASVAQQQSRQQRLAASLEQIQAEQQQLQAQIDSQLVQRETLQQELAALATRQPQARDCPPDDLEITLPTSSEVLGNVEDEASPQAEDELTLATLLPSIRLSQSPTMSLNFSNSEATQQFWETRLLPYWTHRDRAEGQRFLGSFRIARPATDKLLEFVGANLRRVGSLTERRLHDRFTDPQETWVKIVTLALSEYAYYYSDDRFWQGFCDHLNLPYGQNVEKALQTVADRGADLLGLVRAKGGYRYVSTLWLQSGIPQQNLGQFAQLVQDVQLDYGWEHLAEADHTILSEILLETCQTRFPQWGTLKHFLNSSCPRSEDESQTEVDPISGQLVQGIAVVAQELERRNLSPEVLLNDQEREALLENSYLPRNFFLRSWETLTQVISLKDSSSARRRLVSLRPRRLFLEMDLQSLDAQLVLPEQSLWKPEWRTLRGSFCQIPEADWESTIPIEDRLEIPELVIPVKTNSERWECSLYNHNRALLNQWSYPGIFTDFACLIFDALTGEHIPLRQSEPVVIGASEIYCFTPKTTTIEPGVGIEQRDRGVPCSLRGWQGVRLERTELEATISIRDSSLQSIQWKTRSAEPVVQGLRLQGKQAIYLGVPTLWLSPTKVMSLNLLVEDTRDRSILAKTVEETSAEQWRSLPLDSWIQQPGRYEIKLWNASYRWSNRFEVRSDYQLVEPQKQTLQVRYRNQDCSSLPIKVETVTQFLAAEIQISGLWLMESVTVALSNGQDEFSCSLQADRSGCLDISLAKFYEFLSSSETYTFSYQIAGQAPQLLLTVGHAQQVEHTSLLPSLTDSQPLQTVETIKPQLTRPVEQQIRSSAASKWYLVTVNSKKRDVFCKRLTHALNTNSSEQTGILQFQLCTNQIYADYVLVEVQKIGTARKTLREMEHFSSIQPRPLTEANVKRMLGA